MGMELIGRGYEWRYTSILIKRLEDYMMNKVIFSLEIKHLNLLLKMVFGSIGSGLFYKAIVVTLKCQSIV